MIIDYSKSVIVTNGTMKKIPFTKIVADLGGAYIIYDVERKDGGGDDCFIVDDWGNVVTMPSHKSKTANIIFFASAILGIILCLVGVANKDVIVYFVISGVSLFIFGLVLSYLFRYLHKIWFELAINTSIKTLGTMAKPEE